MAVSVLVLCKFGRADIQIKVLRLKNNSLFTEITYTQKHTYCITSSAREGKTFLPLIRQPTGRI